MTQHDDTPSRPILIWRRHHGASLIAQVLTRADADRFEVCAWSSEAEHDAAAQRTSRGTLESAKAAGDDLVRRLFRHKCDWTHCGDWMLWV